MDGCRKRIVVHGWLYLLSFVMSNIASFTNWKDFDADHETPKDFTITRGLKGNKLFYTLVENRA